RVAADGDVYQRDAALFVGYSTAEVIEDGRIDDRRAIGVGDPGEGGHAGNARGRGGDILGSRAVGAPGRALDAEPTIVVEAAARVVIDGRVQHGDLAAGNQDRGAGSRIVNVRAFDDGRLPLDEECRTSLIGDVAGHDRQCALVVDPDRWT